MERLQTYREFEENDVDEPARDALGRRRREFFNRIHPFDRYSEVKFQARYRLSKNLAAALADDFGNSGYSNSGRPDGGGLSHRDRFCLALRYYATGSFYSAIGDTQGVHKSTVCRSVYDVTNFLYDTSETYIKFPRWDEFALYAQDFAAMHGFPCVIGCIDGTHIAIQSPSGDERNFVNRKGYHSLNVMAVCDAFLQFTHVDARWPGASNDAYVLRKSLVGAQGEAGNFHGHWILGDSGYPLKPYLLTPYLEPETPSQEAYNRSLAGTRAAIERAFGVLKRRFRCLDDSGGLIIAEPEKAAQIVTSCMVLHNICVENNLPIRRDCDWDGQQRPRRRRARVSADVFAPVPIGHDRLQHMDPTGGVVRNRLVATRFNR